jgi:uncharacterized protein (TIGR02145 family)
MKKKITLIISVFLISFLFSFAQNISVKSFQSLPNDQTARVYNPVKDQNGEKAALIKVVTNQTGFVWEGGALGITKVEKKTGEYWVYIPRGSKKITIKHDQLGVLRDYRYPEAIKEATTYEMVLTTANVKTVVEEREIPSQWLVIHSEPEGANVFIDDKLAGTTPFQRKYKEGEYTYRIEKPRYHNKAGQISLEDEKKRLDLSLKPQFGDIQITSEPEDDMQIYMDDENTNKTTPATLKEVSSGEHTIMLNSKWFQPKTKKVTVRDEQTTAVDFTLDPAFANVSVTAHPEAEILIDDQVKGTGRWNGRLLEGIYTIKAEKDKYYSQSEQLEVISGEDETLNFTLQGKTGNADIVTTPMDAQVYLDGEKQGTSPLTLNDLLIGSYNIRLEKEGYGIIKKSLIIQENETVSFNEDLPEGQAISITSQPAGAELFIDGNNYGKTPQKLTLSFGDHQVKLIDGSTIIEQSLDVTQFGKDHFYYSLDDTEVIDVTNPATGQTWMDRNLGASRAATGSTDEEAYGGLYQWGRAADGHEKRNSGTTSTLSNSDTPGHGNFITVGSSPYDWRSPQNDNLWQGVNGTNNPCPDGYRLPTAAEWEAERRSWSSNDAAGAFASPLKLPVAGYRYYSGGSLLSVGSRGRYWSSTVDGRFSRSLYFSSSDAGMYSNSRANGYSVRCLKD